MKMAGCELSRTCCWQEDQPDSDVGVCLMLLSAVKCPGGFFSLGGLTLSQLMDKIRHSH